VGPEDDGEAIDREEQALREPRIASQHDRHFHLAVVESSGQAGPTVLDEVDLHVREAAPVAGQERRQHAFDHLRGRADPEHPGLAKLERARPPFQRVGVEDQTAAASDQVLALGREPDAPPDAVEQPHAELGLEGADLPRQGRLTDVQPADGSTEAARVDDGREGAQVSQLHACARRIDSTSINALDAGRRRSLSSGHDARGR
jgi:hypothetical protein